MKKLLVIGCRRSGTTMLASILGGHSQINMLNEAYDKSVDKLVGKKYQGVKLTIPHARWNKRTTTLRTFLYHKTAFMVSWLKKLGIKLDPVKGSAYSIKDFIAMKAKIILIHRDMEENINRIMIRANVTRRQATQSYMKARTMGLCFGDYPYLSIKYKDIVFNPKRELTKICKYLNIPFEKAMLESAGMNNTYGQKEIKFTKRV